MGELAAALAVLQTRLPHIVKDSARRGPRSGRRGRLPGEEAVSAYLAPLERAELDELIRLAEHADRVARIAFVNAPLRPDAVCAAAGVAQDCMNLVVDCYDASMLLHAAEMDRVFDLGGDPPEYQPDEDGER